MHPTYRTFSEMLSDQNKKNPDHVAVITSEYEEKITITYHELYMRVMELASRYRRENCSCVGIYANASAQWIITMYAAVLAGKRTVLFDVLFPPEEMLELAKFCGVDSLYAPNQEGRKIFGDYMSELRAAQIQENPNADIDTVPLSPPSEIEEGGKLLFFTSGTSSENKPVVLSQEALLIDAWGGQQTAQGTSDDLILSMLPTFAAAENTPVEDVADVSAISETERFSETFRSRFSTSPSGCLPTRLQTRWASRPFPSRRVFPALRSKYSTDVPLWSKQNFLRVCLRLATQFLLDVRT